MNKKQRVPEASLQKKAGAVRLHDRSLHALLTSSNFDRRSLTVEGSPSVSRAPLSLARVPNLRVGDCLVEEREAAGNAYDWWRKCKNKEEWNLKYTCCLTYLVLRSGRGVLVIK